MMDHTRTTLESESAPTVVFDDPEVLRGRDAMQAAFEAKIAAETEREARRDKAVALLDALEAGTATGKQVQAVLAFLVRREMGS